MDTFKLQSLVRDSVNFANMPNPNVSSDKASVKANNDQSDPELIESVNISDESRASSSTFLDQGYLIYQSPASSPLRPTTVESSPTTDLVQCCSSHPIDSFIVNTF